MFRRDASWREEDGGARIKSLTFLIQTYLWQKMPEQLLAVFPKDCFLHWNVSEKFKQVLKVFGQKR